VRKMPHGPPGQLRVVRAITHAYAIIPATHFPEVLSPIPNGLPRVCAVDSIIRRIVQGVTRHECAIF